MPAATRERSDSRCARVVPITRTRDASTARDRRRQRLRLRSSTPSRAKRLADVAELDRETLERHGFAADDSQDAAVERLQRLYEDRIGVRAARRSSLIRLLARTPLRARALSLGRRRPRQELPHGQLLHCAPLERKRRIHFHRFMQRRPPRAAHARRARPIRSRRSPRASRSATRLLCLDEFHITDITDAMMMKRLLETLFEQGVVLVHDVELRARPALPARPAAQAVPAGDRAHQGEPRRRQRRQRHRLPAARAREGRRLPPSRPTPTRRSSARS